MGYKSDTYTFNIQKSIKNHFMSTFSKYLVPRKYEKF